jgi:hypothetical protein
MGAQKHGCPDEKAKTSSTDTDTDTDDQVCPCCYCCAKFDQTRFQVGDRVIASVDVWRAGTISLLDYREDRWIPGRTSAYQILLDSPCRFEEDYVHAPKDSNHYVRPLPSTTAEISLLNKNRTERVEQCSGAGCLCALYHVCEDRAKCPKYHFCGREGRRKTRLWEKMCERQARNSGGRELDRKLCSDCQDGDCADFREASIDAILEYVGRDTEKDGPQGKNKKKKKKKKKDRKGGATLETGNAGKKGMQPEPKQHHEKHDVCDCNCHDIAAQGREAIMAMLRKGMDFSPLFEEEAVQAEDSHDWNFEDFYSKELANRGK